MKTIILILSVICHTYIHSQTASNINYDPGSEIFVGSGADICADEIIINGAYSGGGSICTGALPVGLSSFTSSVNKRDVTLMWVTEWEINNSGFRIERLRIDEYVWKEISFVDGHGTSNVPNGYIFKDEKLNAGSYRYRLKQIDYSGNYEYFSLESDVSITPPGNFEMSQNYPNPSNPNSKINFELPVSGRVTIKVYDITGREVITLIDERREADYYTIEFNGTNLASGVYFYRIDVSDNVHRFSKTLKMILVK